MKSLPVLLAISACAASSVNGQTNKSFEICGLAFHLGMTRDEVKQQVWDNVKQQLQLPEEAETRDSLVNLARLQEDTEVVLVGWTKKRHSLDRAAG